MKLVGNHTIPSVPLNREQLIVFDVVEKSFFLLIRQNRTFNQLLEELIGCFALILIILCTTNASSLSSNDFPAYESTVVLVDILGIGFLAAIALDQVPIPLMLFISRAHRLRNARGISQQLFQSDGTVLSLDTVQKIAFIIFQQTRITDCDALLVIIGLVEIERERFLVFRSVLLIRKHLRQIKLIAFKTGKHCADDSLLALR